MDPERARALHATHHLDERDVRADEKVRLERGLLPRPLLRDERLRCVTLYQAGADQALLGGDFYDAVEREDGTVLALAGDVAGRGAEQAELGVRLRAAWRALVLGEAGRADRLSALEDLLAAERHDPEAFVTACEIAIAPDRSAMEVRSAGHPLPILCAPKGVRLAEAVTGAPLGVFPDGARVPACEVDLTGVEAMLLCTDGLLVAFAAPGMRERLGLDGLTDVVRQAWPRAANLGELVAEVVADVQARNGEPLADDVAVLAVGFERR